MKIIDGGRIARSSDMLYDTIFEIWHIIRFTKGNKVVILREYNTFLADEILYHFTENTARNQPDIHIVLWFLSGIVTIYSDKLAPILHHWVVYVQQTKRQSQNPAFISIVHV